MHLWRLAVYVILLLPLANSSCQAAPKARRKSPPRRSPPPRPPPPLLPEPPFAPSDPSPPPLSSASPPPKAPKSPKKPKFPPPLLPPSPPMWPDGPVAPQYPSPPPRPPAPPFPPGVTAPKPPSRPPRPPPPQKSPPLPPYPPNSPHPPNVPPGAHAPLLPPSPPSPPRSTNASMLGYYEQIGMAQVVAVHMVIVPGSNKMLLMERPSGNHPDGSAAYIAGTFDLVDHTWQYVYTSDSLFCCGHTVAADGNVIVVGGHRSQNYWDSGLAALRIFDRKLMTLTTVAQMQYPRWYPTVTLLPDGQVLIMGGTKGVGAGTQNNKFYELWDPSNPTKPTVAVPMLVNYLLAAKQMYYPFNYVLPSGDLFSFCSRFGRILDPYTGVLKAVLPNFGGAFNTEYPYTGTSVLLPLMPETGYQVDVVIFGGQDIHDSSAPRPGLQASPWSRQISMAPDGNGSYTFGAWDVEYMGMPRVMGDATLLPNGKVILLDGAMYGEAGDAAPGGGSNAFYPAFYAYLFDPTAPEGTKFRQLERSMIARLYHSTACLTIDGTIVVAGCDRCYKFTATMDYFPATTSTGNPIKAEYRVEMFYPPYYYALDKPTFTSAPATINYGAEFTVQYTGTVTRVTLVASSSTTHSFNTHQRVVGLVIKNNNIGTKTLTIVGPPTKEIAVPAMYMLFLLNGDDYGKGAWVTLLA